MKIYELLEVWRSRCLNVMSAHHESAAYYERYHYYLGIPLVVISTFVGTSVFVSLQKDISIIFKVFVGLISVLNAILAALQTFLRHEQRSEKHRIAGIKYGVLLREIEQKISTSENLSQDMLEKFLNDWRIRYDQINQESPIIPRSIWNRARYQKSAKSIQENGINSVEGSKA